MEKNSLKKMKNSGIEWIGEMPIGWSLEKLQWYLDEIKEQNNPVKTEQVLSLTNKLGVIPYEEKGEQGNKAKESLNEYKIAYPNTIVANSMNLLIGSVGICNYTGCVSPVYYVFKPNKKCNIRFINYIFQTEGFQKELRKYANGILEIRLRVSSSGILKRKIAIPNLDVQNKIVHFIDGKVEKIDALINNEEQQIEKLIEYKQSLITEIVTKGLDKNAKMKDSGVEWIGKIPKDWEEKKLKFTVDKINKGKGITKDEIRENGDICCVRYGEIYSKYNYSFDKCISRTNESLIDKKEYFEYGDILCAGTGELIEEIGKSIVYLGKEKCLAGGDIIIIKHEQESRFLNYTLNSIYTQIQKSMGKMKLKVVHISASDIGNIILAIPPIDEQKEIADYIDNKSNSINKLIEIKKEKINKLHEYKKSLIYEYVTGKKEV